MSEGLSVWIVYDHPSDMPEWFVARKRVVTAGQIALTTLGMRSHDLETLRRALRDLGLTCMPRAESDDPVIVETWI